MNVRKLRLAAAVSLALATPGAFALGLGDIEMRSALNQPMNAEIRLTSVEPGELDGMIVKLASPEAFARAGIERSAILTGLRFTVDESGAAPTIRITSQSPVVEPFLNFLIEIDWPQGRMVREYTVLLDPPVFMTPSASGRGALEDGVSLAGRDEGALLAPAPIERDRSSDGGEAVSLDELAGAAEAVDPQRAAEQGEVVALSDLASPNTDTGTDARSTPGFDFDVELIGGTQEVADEVVGADAPDAGQVVSLDELLDEPVPATRDTPAPAKPEAITEREVVSGDTLFRIAQELQGDGVSVEQTMLALLAANESAFIEGNINLVRAGAILRVPDSTATRRITQAQAAAEVSKQATLWQEYRDSRRAAGGTRLAGIPAGDAEPEATDPVGTNELTDASDVSGTSDEAAARDDALTASAEAIMEEARREIRELEQLRIVGEDAITDRDGNEAAVDDAGRLNAIEQRLRLAREQLASSRQEAGDLSDQAAELRGTTTDFDSLIALRQNDIAALEARLEEARERALTPGEPPVDPAGSADASASGPDGALDGVRVGDDTSTTGLDGAAGEDAVGNSLAEGMDAIGSAGDEAGQAVRDALPSDGTNFEGVDPVDGYETLAANDPLQESTEAIEEDPNAVDPEAADEAAAERAGADAATDAGAIEQARPWYQSLLADPARLAIAGVGALALFGALGTLLWRRRRENDPDAWLEDDADEPIVDTDAADPARVQAAAVFDEPQERDDTHDTTLSAVDDPALQTSDQTATELAGLGEDSLDKDDTISEVDVYLAYGLHGQAEELLSRAIKRDPNNPAYVQKLLETYHAQGNAEAFGMTADDWQARFGGTSHPDWPAIAVMGRELQPGSTAFAAGETAAEPLAGEDDDPALFDQSLDPAFAFDAGDLEATGDFSTLSDEIVLDEDKDTIEFDAEQAFAPIDRPAPSNEKAPGNGAGSGMTGIEAPELQSPNALEDDLTLDLDKLSDELALESTEMLEIPDLTADNDLLTDEAELVGDADEVDTMMDLAKAYIDMGDKDSASSTLGEIVKSGNPDQVTEAETLLRKIS